MKLFERGSEWRRWDLHLHTASSYDYEYNATDSDEILVQKLQDNNIVAAAITDHFVIDKDRIASLKSLAPNIVFFPGVELRTDKGDTNIHVILIFSDAINLDVLVEDFNVFKRSAKNYDDNEKIYWDYNAIVVLGADAEEIIIANQAGSKSENKEKRFEYRSGAIENDNPVYAMDGSIESGILNSKGIQQHICDILEGGEIAFEKRKNKYRI